MVHSAPAAEDASPAFRFLVAAVRIPAELDACLLKLRNMQEQVSPALKTFPPLKLTNFALDRRGRANGVERFNGRTRWKSADQSWG